MSLSVCTAPNGPQEEEKLEANESQVLSKQEITYFWFKISVIIYLFDIQMFCQTGVGQYTKWYPMF